MIAEIQTRGRAVRIRAFSVLCAGGWENHCSFSFMLLKYLVNWGNKRTIKMDPDGAIVL
jgi:hypothetical protein